MGKITILPETTKDPISLMGRRAGICWGADITDAEKNYKKALHLIDSLLILVRKQDLLHSLE